MSFTWAENPRERPENGREVVSLEYLVGKDS